jgi:hypothetical protein
MPDAIRLDKVRQILDRVRDSIRHDECWTCDCLQGFLAQLEMDAEPAAAELIEPLKVPATQMHGCLGCDPCPPGAAFADYLRGMNQQAGDAACPETGCCCKNQRE